jgi:glycosyltransferase involved in cell wall biosynthesis
MSDHPARVLFANPVSGITGAENAMLELMGNLDRHQFQPILLVPRPGLLTDLCSQQGISTVFLDSIPSPGGRARDTYRTVLSNAVKIARLVKHLGIDLVHSNSPRMAYHSGLGARLSGVPHITHVRDFSSSPFFSLPKVWFLNSVSDRFIAISVATQSAITCRTNLINYKVRLVYDGLPPAPSYDLSQKQALRAEFGMIDRFPLLAVVGSISHLKGQEVVLQSLPAILTQYPQARLLLVGEPTDAVGREYIETLKIQIRSLGLREQVVFTGFRRDVPLIMASIDCLIHAPVLPEALGHVLLEASAQETPIVASDIGGIAEVIIDGKTGCLVRPGQPGELASVVLALLADRNRCVLMGRAARERVCTEFSIIRHVSQIEAIYQEILAQRK